MLEINQRDADAWYNKGYALAELGRFDEAIKCYDKALEINPQTPDAWRNKALAEDKLGRKLDAAKSYKKFISLASTGQYAKEIQAARKRLLELDTDASVSAFHVSSPEDVTSVMDKVFKPPTKKQLEALQHVNRGAEFFTRGRWTEAEEEFKMAVEIDPKNATAHGNMGWLLLRQERFDKAIQWFEKAINLNPHLKGAAEGLSKAKENAKKMPKRKTLDEF